MKLLFITVNRSDYSIWRPILRLIKKNLFDVEIGLYVTGGHLSIKHGYTLTEIKSEDLYDKLFDFPCTVDNDSPLGSASALSMLPASLGYTINSFSPDMICVLGDRYEVVSCALTASLFRLPIVHFHGGSVTEGALDDNFRHAITKLSHYHFVECAEFRNRLIQLGEDSQKIIISGAPSLNELRHFSPISAATFESKFGFGSEKKFILTTLHSETTKSLDYNRKMAANFFEALHASGKNILVTAPNPDPYSECIFAEIDKSVKLYPNRVKYVPHLGHVNYFNAMSLCDFVAGNSSSGIIEAASFKKLVLNVGERQKNRASDRNVVHTDHSLDSINFGLKQVSKYLKDSDFFSDWNSMYFQADSERLILEFFGIHRRYYQKQFRDRFQEVTT